MLALFSFTFYFCGWWKGDINSLFVLKYGEVRSAKVLHLLWLVVVFTGGEEL